MNQTELEHPRNGTLSVLLAFVGGALVGGTAALLLAPRTGADTRRRITGAVDDTREVAARVPNAVRQASTAAQVAFTAALKESAGGDEVASKRQTS
jgi:gas vesicle protein